MDTKYKKFTLSQVELERLFKSQTLYDQLYQEIATFVEKGDALLIPNLSEKQIEKYRAALQASKRGSAFWAETVDKFARKGLRVAATPDDTGRNLVVSLVPLTWKRVGRRPTK